MSSALDCFEVELPILFLISWSGYRYVNEVKYMDIRGVNRNHSVLVVELVSHLKQGDQIIDKLAKSGIRATP